MSALILKDFYVLRKQVGFFLIFILIFSCLPGQTFQAFAVIYAALLPYTCLAYDERSKWDQLAAVLPYSVRDIVLGKYVLGWIATAGAAVLCGVIQLVLSLTGAGSFSPAGILTSMCASVCIMALTLPLMFRFSVERGRLMVILIIFLVCSSAGVINAVSTDVRLDDPIFALTLPVTVGVAVILTLISVPLSIRFYRRRR